LQREPRRTRQAGFTLIELSITVVLAGLIVGAAFTGRELIAPARAKSLVADFHAVRHAMDVYQDRYHALPGDDRLVYRHLAGARVSATSGNGLIDGAWDSQVPTDEAMLFWEHLRLAGLVLALTESGSGDPRPRHFAGGIIGVSSALPDQRQVAGLGGSFQMCARGVPGRLALALDRLLDDGDTSMGSVRLVPDGSAAGAAATVTPAVMEGAAYTVCQSF
jgi:prepilin-type N-terminal cleavage/methylation domain-containing protein